MYHLYHLFPAKTLMHLTHSSLICLLFSVSAYTVSLDYSNKIPEVGWIRLQALTSHSSGGWKLQIRVVQVQFLVRTLFLGGHLFTVIEPKNSALVSFSFDIMVAHSHGLT